MIARRLLAAFGVFAALFVFCALAPAAHAHERSSSRSTWRLEPGAAQVTLSISARDLAQLDETARADAAFVADYFASQLTAHSAAGPCSVVPGSLRTLVAQQGRPAWQWRLACPEASSLVIESQLFARTAPHHLHFVRITTAEGTAHQLLTEDRRSVEVALAAPAVTEGFMAWLELGTEHVLTGYDHLAFLLALLVGAATLGALAWTLTGFTLGHALTLALASLGQLQANTPLVEALIGLSIVIVAVENAWSRSTSRRAPLPAALVAALCLGAGFVTPEFRFALLALALGVACSFGLRARGTPTTWFRALVAGAFGLVHGLGFASALGEHGLPRHDLLPALVGFNLGVELGQLLAVAAVWVGLAALAARRPALRSATLDLANGATCAAGVYWTLTRLV